MGSDTAISWTGATWNPWMGCRKVSQGCKNCYMYRDMAKYGRDPMTVVRSKTTFTAPLKWKDPQFVFTCSWSDFFIEEADAWREEAWDIIRRTPHLTYQILTKRPERIAQHLPNSWGTGWANVWLGVSVENQDAVGRMAQLAEIPAVVRFVSAEPLLGPIHTPLFAQMDWVIIGGESGPKRREMEMAWAREVRDQCVEHGVAVWFKQQSALKPGYAPYIVESDGTHTEWRQYPITASQKLGD